MTSLRTCPGIHGAGPPGPAGLDAAGPPGEPQPGRSWSPAPGPPPRPGGSPGQPAPHRHRWLGAVGSLEPRPPPTACTIAGGRQPACHGRTSGSALAGGMILCTERPGKTPAKLAPSPGRRDPSRSTPRAREQRPPPPRRNPRGSAGKVFPPFLCRCLRPIPLPRPPTKGQDATPASHGEARALRGRRGAAAGPGEEGGARGRGSAPAQAASAGPGGVAA